MKTGNRYRHLAPLALRRWRGLASIGGLTLAGAMLAALQPWPVKMLVDHALGGVGLPGYLQTCFDALGISPTPLVLIGAAALARLGVFMLNSAVEAAQTWAWAITGQRAVYDLGVSLFQRLQRLSLGYHTRCSVGEALSRLSGDTYGIYTLLESVLISPLRYLFTLGAIGAVAWSMDPELTQLAFVIAPVMAGSALFFGPRLKRYAQRNREIQSRLMSFVHQTLSVMPIVQAFGRERPNGRRFRSLADDAIGQAQRGNLARNAYGAANGTVAALGMALVLYVAGNRVLSGTLSLGSLLVFLSYLRALQSAFQGLLGIYGRLKVAGVRIDRVLEVLESEEEVNPPRHPKTLPPKPEGRIRIDDVSFGYLPDAPVLHHICLDIPPGQTLALVGPTGAGKSTLVSLIPRFFDPWMGTIAFDGCDIKTLALTDLRNQIALVLQDPFLLPLTVAENIAYGRPDAAYEHIVDAAEAAHAHDFIQRLPNGYDTVLAERGASLSGGQKQRIAIARALLKDAPVLILDEPTAALDAQTEALVVDALARLRQGRTAIVIAHRLSTIRHADCIAVLSDGHLVQLGTHHQLIQQNGPYRQYCDLQFGQTVGV